MVSITNINQYVIIIIIQLLPYLVFLIKSNQCQSGAHLMFISVTCALIQVTGKHMLEHFYLILIEREREGIDEGKGEEGGEEGKGEDGIDVVSDSP